MRLRRGILVSLGILTAVTLALAGRYYYNGFYRPLHRHNRIRPSIGEDEMARLQLQVNTQKRWLQLHHFNTSICFLADMKMPSGKNRFFVYDLQNDSIILSGLVAHGCGNARFAYTPTFSNVAGSSCTSLGKYRIGCPYQGSFGRSYKLYGLDTSNDRAFVRNVVLHSYNEVPAGETDPLPICNSRGCAMVAPSFLEKLQPLIDQSQRPILLYIFN